MGVAVLKIRLRRLLFLSAICCAFFAPKLALAQVSVYGGFTASELKGGPAGDYLLGGTGGALFDLVDAHRFTVSTNLQVRDVVQGGERLVGIAAGPRVSVPFRRIKMEPYAEFLVGFARYRADSVPAAENTTDDQWQTNAGIARPISSHLDVTAEYSYAQYGADFGRYHPKSYSAGVIVHFSKHR